MGRKVKLHAWTLSSAEAEFGLERHTIKRKLAEAGQQPDEKGRFTTRQLCLAIFGDLRGEQKKLVAAQAEEKRLKIEERRGRLISIEDAEAVCNICATAIRQRIVNLPISKEERQKVLLEINGLAKIDFRKVEEMIKEEEGAADDDES